MMTLSEHIKIIRTNADINQKDMAELLGISPQYLNDLEHDRRQPSDEVMRRYSGELKVNYDYMYFLIGKLPPDIATQTSMCSEADVLKALNQMRSTLCLLKSDTVL